MKLNSNYTKEGTPKLKLYVLLCGLILGTVIGAFAYYLA
jgi:hypothetical protein